jgi:hypothetical protein
MLIGRAVFPELLRRLLGVRAPIAERPEEATLADDVDLGALRGLVAVLLPA